MAENEIRCYGCGERLTGYSKLSTTFCSDRCMKEYWDKVRSSERAKAKRGLRKKPKPIPADGIYPVSTSTRGAVGELIVANVLLMGGFEVFRSLSPNAKCDLVAIKGTDTLKIEVRSGQVNNDRVTFTAKRIDNADYYGIYYQREKEIMVEFRKKLPQVVDGSKLGNALKLPV